ncbi:MAG: GAF domain-containing protein [Gammaproteobacteria bacterium]
MRPEQLTLQARTERGVRAMVVLTHRWPTYESDPAQATRAIIQAAAVALGVERASLWLLNDDSRALVCQDLYEVSPHRHSRGFKHTEADCPAYFAALQSEGWIIAADAQQDPRTQCFASGYLAPHGIGAILDMPIRIAGAVAGVLRLEHVGGPRMFQTDEQLTASFLATLASLGQEFQRRAGSEKRLERAESLLDASLDATGAAVIVVDQRGSVVHYNRRMLDLWRMDESLMGPEGDGGRRFEHVAAQTSDPARFIARYRRISADSDESSHDVIELSDGRTIVRTSAPQWFDGHVIGRAWSFREV